MDNKTIVIQKHIRRYMYQRKHLPNSILYIQKLLKENEIICSNQLSDGRNNSNFDEETIIKILKEYLGDRLWIPKARHWFDFSVKDYQFGWLPINIKSTTTKTADNAGNIAMCVYALTNEKLNIRKNYTNGPMADILFTKLQNKEYNYIINKDYYFVVVNKNNTCEIIVNSIKGLKKINPNLNNLPFQIKWSVNKNYHYRHIVDIIKLFLEAINKPERMWKIKFLTDCKSIYNDHFIKPCTLESETESKLIKQL